MAATKNSSENIDLADFEALLSELSEQDLENINDLVDPEVTVLVKLLYYLLLLCNSSEFLFTSKRSL